MDYTDLLYTADKGVARITINRPERYNAFRLQTVEELIHAFERADADTDVGVIVLTGTGDKAFSSGGDVAGEAAFTPHKAWMFNRRLLNLSAIMRNTGKPVIGRINGFCIGGGNELNMLCDLSIASERAKFGQAGTRIGSVPIWYGTQMLPRVVGDKRAREIVLLCHQYTAAEAERMGWINRVVPHEQLDAAVDEWCRELLEKSPTALLVAKLSLNFDSDTLYPSVVHGFRMLNLGLHGSPEQKEGMTAFLEKRKPDFAPFRW
ncbi:MAG: enoyl-CoA hydratase/isomerase family protein [Candidatus Rokubacteria bacterium]|nr:enoyl-CoA hydratase/isomerase family protein [Candidatus Rokubacteria bacterium]